MTRGVSQESVVHLTVDIMELIDVYMGYGWSAENESDKTFDKLHGILDELFGYPRYRVEK